MIINRHICSLLLTLSFLLAAFAGSLAQADPLDPELGQRAIAIAQKIKEDSLDTTSSTIAKELATPNLSPEKRLSLLRHRFWYAIDVKSQRKLTKLANTYLAEAKKIGEERDIQIGHLFESFARLYSFNDSEVTRAEAVNSLQPYLNSSDWFIAHRTFYLRNVIDKDLRNPNLAVENSKKAFLLIPEENNIYVNEAKIISYEDMAYHYNLLKNPKLAIENTESLIKLSDQEKLPINGADLINNFMYSFGSWRDFETTKALGEILWVAAQKTTASKPGLTEMRLSTFHNELTNYNEALNYANQSLSLAKSQNVLGSAKMNKIIALAGLGRNKEAQRALDNFITEQTNDGQALPSRFGKKIDYARALMALNIGDKATAQKYFNARVNKYVQDILSSNTSETASMLAELQNSTEREAERELALQRETRLKDIALAGQKKTNQLLLFLSAVFTACALAASFFLRYRANMSKQLAVAAKRAKAGDKAKTEFLAVASHELRTPLNGIIGLSDAMRRSVKNPDLKMKNELVYKSGMELLHVVENILEMTQIESGTVIIYPEKISPRDVITSIANEWKTFAQEHGAASKNQVIFTYHIDDSVPKMIKVDKRRLQQCINNLLSNAVKFTPNGRIHMHVKASEPDENNQISLEVIVADTGIGITHDIIEDLFRPFAQADSSRTRLYSGTGLGLAITKSLAELMDGTISVNSKVGRGSEFTLIIPATTQPVLEQVLPIKLDAAQKVKHTFEKNAEEAMQNEDFELVPASLNQTPAALPKETHSQITRPPLNILLADDDLGNQNVICSYLKPSGIQVTCVENGDMAVSSLEHQQFDLILMDVRMPETDGIMAIKIIRASDRPYKDIPIIALTADVDPKTNSSCILAGANLFLKKPISAKALLEAIDFVLARQADRRAKLA